jgi:hypothetical protein
MRLAKQICYVAAVLAWSLGGAAAWAQDKAATTQPTASGDLAPIEIKLPKPAYTGTPKPPPTNPNLEPPSTKPRPPFLAPKGVSNVALGKPVTSSDKEPIIGKLSQVTDGIKDGTEGNWVELGPGIQWVQIDLGKVYEIAAIVLWHHHGDPRVYRDVVVQVADDADFISNVKTLYNNDIDNSSGLGLGKDREYFETFEGRLIDGKGVKARYVKLSTNGSTADDQNHYTEVEVYGK